MDSIIMESFAGLTKLNSYGILGLNWVTPCHVQTGSHRKGLAQTLSQAKLSPHKKTHPCLLSSKSRESIFQDSA
jgi:hypothetical protein